MPTYPGQQQQQQPRRALGGHWEECPAPAFARWNAARKRQGSGFADVSATSRLLSNVCCRCCPFNYGSSKRSLNPGQEWDTAVPGLSLPQD